MSRNYKTSQGRQSLKAPVYPYAALTGSLDECFLRLNAQGSQRILLYGVAGAGKSTCLSVLQEQAEDDFAVVVLQGYGRTLESLIHRSGQFLCRQHVPLADPSEGRAESLLTRLRAYAGHRKLLFLIDDAHETDDDALRVFFKFLERVSPNCAVVAAAESFNLGAPPDELAAHFDVSLRLQGLHQKELGPFIEAIQLPGQLPTAAMSVAYDRSAGVPGRVKRVVQHIQTAPRPLESQQSRVPEKTGLGLADKLRKVFKLVDQTEYFRPALAVSGLLAAGVLILSLLPNADDASLEDSAVALSANEIEAEHQANESSVLAESEAVTSNEALSLQAELSLGNEVVSLEEASEGLLGQSLPGSALDSLADTAPDAVPGTLQEQLTSEESTAAIAPEDDVTLRLSGVVENGTPLLSDDESRLLSNRSDGFVLQLSASPLEKASESIRSRYSELPLLVYRSDVGGVTWYKVVSEPISSRAEAADLKQQHSGIPLVKVAWLKDLAAVREEIEHFSVVSKQASDESLASLQQP